MEEQQGELFTEQSEDTTVPKESDNNGFTKYIVVGYDKDNGLSIGIPDDVSITVADLWAFAGILKVKADNFYSYNIDKIDDRVIQAIRSLTTQEQPEG